PTWGRPEATQSGGGLLAPLPPERKYANQRGCKAAAAALQGPSRSDAHRPLSTGYPAEYRDDSAPVRLPRHRSAPHRAGWLSDLRPRFSARRDGLSRCCRDRAASLVARFRILAPRRGPPPRAV